MRVQPYRVKCPVCGALFDSYEEYVYHVFSRHPDSLRMRFRGEVVRE